MKLARDPERVLGKGGVSLVSSDSSFCSGCCSCDGGGSTSGGAATSGGGVGCCNDSPCLVKLVSGDGFEGWLRETRLRLATCAGLLPSSHMEAWLWSVPLLLLEPPAPTVLIMSPLLLLLLLLLTVLIMSPFSRVGVILCPV